MLQTVRAEKVAKKMRSFFDFPCFFPEFLSVNCPKKCIFYNFMLTSARNLSLLKQFTYIQLKDLVKHFQKMVLFIMFYLTVSEILVFKSNNFVKILRSQHFFDILIANISSIVAQTPIIHTIFSKNLMTTFRCKYLNYFKT